jgi:Uma2 family endonuclease
MTIATVKPYHLTERLEFVPLSVDQYHRMIDTGILSGSGIELIEGLLVPKNRAAVGEDPMSVGDDHANVVDRLGYLNAFLHARGCYIRVQQPIVIAWDSEPEPDALIVRGSPKDYGAQRPAPADASCVIEVAESSLASDRSVKLRIYAQASFPQYVIVNLVDRIVEEYRDPIPSERRYVSRRVLSPGETLSILLPDRTAYDLPVVDLFP